MKKKIAFMVVIIFIALYVCAFCYARDWAKEPVIKYYDGNESIVYDGIEYTLSAVIMSEEKLVEEYGIPKENLASYIYNNPDVEFEYIIVKRVRKRVGDSVCKYEICSLVSKYVLAGGWPEVAYVLNGGETVKKQDLEMGQEVEDYVVYISNPKNVCNKIDIEKQTFYYEFPDYEGHEYLSWVRVLN